MSKVVKIPDCSNPFEVIINNNKYRYPAGATVEVPDEVAAIIEAHEKQHDEEAKHKIDPPFDCCGGEGGSSDAVLTKTEKALILTLFENAAYTSDAMKDVFSQLKSMWNSGTIVANWVIGIGYSNGGYLSTVSGTTRTAYVSENGDYPLKYTTAGWDKKYYPVEFGDSNSVAVTCPSNMTPAVAALKLNNEQWVEAGTSGWMKSGGGVYSFPSGATHFICVMKKTNESAFVQEDFENVVVSLS